jgi:hypothetical protein
MDGFFAWLITGARLLRGAWGVMWLFIGGVMVVAGVVMTIGTLIGEGDHEWWVGPVGTLIGLWIGGYFSLYSAWKDKRGKDEHMR